MHPLLLRQLKRLGFTTDRPPSEEGWRRWIELVDGSYRRADEDRRLLERSLSISSKEMAELTESLRSSEAALAAERDKLSATIAGLDEGLCLLDGEGRVVLLNPAGRRLLGMEERPGSRLLSQIAPQLEWDPSRRVREENAVFLRADGTRLSVSYVLSPVEGVGSVLAFRDISELVRAKSDLERSHYQLQAIIRSAPIAMAMLDDSMRYLAFSERWLSDWRLKGSTIVGKSHFDVFPDLPDRWRKIYGEALAGRVHSVPEEIVRRADGSVMHVRWAAHPWLSLDGGVGGIVLVSDRIDDLVRAREVALEAARTKAQFLANMSHEIRTPMNGVLGMTELLLAGELEGEQREFAETIYESADNLLGIINEILDFSKLEAGRIELEEIEFDPRALIQSVVDLLAPRAQRKALEIACFTFQDVPTGVRGDPARLRQVLVNLVGNAVKFTQSGHVTLTLRRVGETRMGGGEGALLRFEVEDTGIGIESDAQRTVFDPFTQADGSTTRKYGGSGLGLAISKQLVETMRGKIGVDSVPGKGSCFHLTVPLATCPGRGSTPEPRRELVGLRVLAVDDNPVNRRILQLQCASWGVELDLFDGSEAALERLRSEMEPSYDLALVDFAMPDMDGLALARAVRQEPALDGLRLVLLSSMVDRNSSEEVTDAGFDAYLTKPLHEQVLFNTLRSVMGIQTETPRSRGRLVDAEHAFRTNFLMRTRVLLVEDNLVNRKVAVHMLEKLGCVVDVAENGWRAVEAIRENEYDVILMDCQMPGLDGFEATRIVRDLERQDGGMGRRSTIVALTAHAMEGDRERCLEAGMDEYLTKPLKLEKLSECLKSLRRMAS